MKKRGMTLIEVLLAVVILGLGLSILVTSAGRCLSVVRKSRNYENARHLLGLLELEEPLDTENIKEGTESGRFDEPYEQYQWTRIIEETGEEDSGLYKIIVRIGWSDRNTDVYEEVQTYLYLPPEGGQVESR